MAMMIHTLFVRLGMIASLQLLPDSATQRAVPPEQACSGRDGHF